MNITLHSFALCLTSLLGLVLSVMQGTSLAAELPAASASHGIAEMKRTHAALVEGRFAELEVELGAVQAAYEADTNREADAEASFQRFEVSNPELTPAFEKWIAAFPRSYSARLARGAHFFAMGIAWRGSGYIQSTHPARVELMLNYMRLADKDLRDAVALTERPILAYQRLIEIARYIGARDAAYEYLVRAAKTDPYAIGPYQAYAALLRPRWGGSYEAMAALANDVVAADHPKMKRLSSYIRSLAMTDKANATWSGGNPTAALTIYQEAIALSAEHNWPQCELAELYVNLGQIDNAIATASRALKRDEFAVDCLVERARAYLNARRETERLEDLRNAAFLGNVDAAKNLGLLLADGANNVKRDMTEGLYWMERAAYFWNVDALFESGVIYEHGHGVPVNFARAVENYRACANLKNLKCENNLGLMLWYGKGIAANPDEAARLWIRVHKKGDWHGRHNLEYFFSPTERVVFAFRHGPGLWALAPLATLALIALGALLIAWIVIRRPFAARAGREPS